MRDRRSFLPAAMKPAARRVLRAWTCACAFAWAVANPFGRALAADGPLPPGLYRIDTDSTFTMGSASFHARSDAATGERVEHTTLGGVESVERRMREAEPVQYCVGAHGGEAVAPDGSALRCSNQTTRTVDGVTTHRAVCPGGNLKLTLRRLDDNRWEYLSEVEAGGAGVAPDLDAMRPLLEREAREGKTEQARAQARARLAALPAMQAEGVQKRADARERLEAALGKERNPGQREALRRAIAAIGGTVAVTGRTRHVWTRIAETCGGAQVR